QQPCLFDQNARLGDSLLRDRLFAHEPSKRTPARGAAAHGLQPSLRHADEPHAMMDAPRPQPALSDLKSPSLPQQEILNRYPDVLEPEFRMAMRSIVIAENRQMPLQSDSGRIHWDQNHRLLKMHIGVVRGTLAHENDDFAPRVIGAR